MFEGYSDETFEFFMAIGFNNNAAFFHENHDWYMRGVRAPSLALAQSLSKVIEEIDPNLERRPDRVVSRINRDTRFSHNKSPYRDYIWLSFHLPGEERSRHMELYFDISAQGAGYGMGMYLQNKSLMNALRKRMVEEPERVLQLLAQANQRFECSAETYKRMQIPEELPPLLKQLYPLKNIGFYRQIQDFDLIKSPTLAQEIESGYRILQPMYSYINALTPIEDAPN